MAIDNINKMIPEYIDLHIHTTVSDGTDTPEEIINKVRAAGIDMFSITDHDAIDGAVEVSKITAKDDYTPVFIKGIEFSCRDSFGKYHILGYDYDETKAEFTDVVKWSHEMRISKVKARIEFLKSEFGFSFSKDDIQKLFQNSNPGKPHIAKMMIKYGYASSVKEAFNNYLNRKKFPNEYLTPEKAIRAVIGGNGIPVLAHPAYGDGSQLIIGEDMDKRLKRLKEFGLQGIECYYSAFTPKLVQEMLDFADKYDFLVTAGSDYHGLNKLVMLGDTNLKKVSEGSRRLRDFLERKSFR